ncbi:aldose 1-epimerase family protein YeaD [Klebsiella grimontii]|uniref:Aldose 1-epimerase family protein YeaD n=1 Tax=Klebsiella grimontii TaxID=2058152 RepID=A0A7H4P5J6_9ENTR|nr:aldose 1-epimerase family protein YeaD [Klebsiella grimontii]
MINKIFALPVIEQLTPVLSRRQLDDLELIVVDHPQVKASVALQGAHLLSWKPAGEEEVLWLSGNTPFKNGVALRGGVPICWPWFGPSAQPGLPSHGFARNLPWALKGHDEDDKGAVLTFELKSSEATRQYWPHEFTLLARFKLGKTCEIELEAHGEFETTSALHTYFNVGDIAAVKVSGLGERYIDKVKKRGRRRFEQWHRDLSRSYRPRVSECRNLQRDSRRCAEPQYRRYASSQQQRGGLEPGSGAFRQHGRHAG